MKIRFSSRKRKIAVVALLSASCLVLAACDQPGAEQAAGDDSKKTWEATGMVAEATLSPTEGCDATGTVTFVEVAGGVHVTGRIENLDPGMHGFHVHEHGDCSAPDAASAGGHYNPEGTPHAGRKAIERHVGDLGNIEANEEGVANVDFYDSEIELRGDHSIIGRSLIVHAGEDDLSSQPSGAAGPRVACGVVTKVASES